jgi:rhodanese-related sulfurtransferase
MNLALTLVAVVIWGWLAVVWIRRIKARREVERLSITPEALHALLEAHQEGVVVLDARQPLDLLTDSEIIAGAQRISPQDAMENPGLIPTDKELVVYCTCPSDKTSRAIVQKARTIAPNVDINRVKFLKGGLAAWKAKGYPVVPYDKTFRLDTGT